MGRFFFSSFASASNKHSYSPHVFANGHNVAGHHSGLERICCCTAATCCVSRRNRSARQAARSERGPKTENTQNSKISIALRGQSGIPPKNSGNSKIVTNLEITGCCEGFVALDSSALEEATRCNSARRCKSGELQFACVKRLGLPAVDSSSQYRCQVCAESAYPL